MQEKEEKVSIESMVQDQHDAQLLASPPPPPLLPPLLPPSLKSRLLEPMVPSSPEQMADSELHEQIQCLEKRRSSKLSLPKPSRMAALRAEIDRRTSTNVAFIEELTPQSLQTLPPP